MGAATVQQGTQQLGTHEVQLSVQTLCCGGLGGDSPVSPSRSWHSPSGSACVSPTAMEAHLASLSPL